MKKTDSTSRRKVALAIFPEVQALDVAGPLDVLAEANTFVAPGDGYDIEMVSVDSGAIRASNGTLMLAHATCDAADGYYDTALVAGGPGMPDDAPDPRLGAWLVSVSTRCRRLGSICTGAFALGHAGLLDGRAATTLWCHTDKLARAFPLARVEPDRIWVRDGQLVTSAGVTAGIDLALALVAEDHGPRVSLAVAKRLVVYAQRRGGQSQFSPYLGALVADDSPVARVQSFVLAHLNETLSIQQLAQVAKMSERSFARVFVETTDITPREFVERARVDAARNALESSDRPLKVIAYNCGFGTAERMRTVFKKRLGVSPNDYRASFGIA
ncbi:GlxA family transcriptional regulator [Paraburkholderia sp.]|uniref:GlxA family transcriptional regulator n=1 Tax=Paraburkholderia sp. TaxID=1926495 RepID=UPI0023A4E125|nr:GlxA family transcriptional regulator [Paraburkholderia sp.]MDE1182512.1 GlxA family transcriptional regulator [Paraburkholderia sp.]